MALNDLDLDLGPSLGDAGLDNLADSTGGAAGAVALPPADPRDGLAYDVDKWSRLLYEGRREASTTLNGAAEKVEGVVGEHNAEKVTIADGATPADEKRALDAREQVRALGKTAGDAFAAEVFSRLYGDPEKKEQAHGLAPWSPVAHEILDQLPEWETLRAAVAGDPDFAALATSDVLAPIAARLPELLKEVEQEQAEQDAAEGQEDGPEGQGRQGGGQGAGHGKKPGQPTAKDRLRAGLRAGLQNAQQQAASGKETLAGLAPGLEAAPPTHEHPDATRLRLVELVAKDDRLREVLRRAGRLRRIADRKRQERRSIHAREEVVDLERGNDLARILPSQLMGLKHPILRKMTLLGIASSTLLQYRLEGKEPQGRGPIVVILDASGSMSGDPMSWANAVGIACMGLAVREKRPVTVLHFDTRVKQVVHVNAKGEASFVDSGRNGKITAIPGGIAQAAMAIAGFQAGGGTDYDVAMKVALDGLPNGIRDERADFVFVSDGDCTIQKDTLDFLAVQRKGGMRCYGLLVNGGSMSEAVRAICDHVVDIDRVKGDAEGIADALPV
jgi:uncharacterized protein with von Willebrand factor type A (vWA) domain